MLRGTNQGIELKQFYKKIDVKKVKSQLWTYIDPEVASSKIVLTEKDGEEKTKLKMSSMMSELYDEGGIDSENVSVHSAFICLLHLCNEKGKEVK